MGQMRWKRGVGGVGSVPVAIRGHAVVAHNLSDQFHLLSPLKPPLAAKLSTKQNRWENRTYVPDWELTMMRYRGVHGVEHSVCSCGGLNDGSEL